MPLSKDKFVQDAPWNLDDPQPNHPDQPLIDGVIMRPLVPRADDRGHLIELLTQRDGDIAPMVHTYQVFAAPDSVRAWIYHAKQRDRLCYTDGHFRIVLYDIREDSPTRGMLNVFDAGQDNPSFLEIPQFVVHGVKNIGGRLSSFVNSPTEVYDLENPDKFRLPYPDAHVPYVFE